MGLEFLPVFQGVVSEIQDAVLASSGVEGFHQKCLAVVQSRGGGVGFMPGESRQSRSMVEWWLI